MSFLVQKTLLYVTKFSKVKNYLTKQAQPTIPVNPGCLEIFNEIKLIFSIYEFCGALTKRVTIAVIKTKIKKEIYDKTNYIKKIKSYVL